MNIGRLRKVLALMDSPVLGERDAARAKLEAMLAAEGKAWRDLPSLLGGGDPTTSRAPASSTGTAPSAGAAAPFRSFEDFWEEREPGFKAKAAAERARKAEEAAAYRAAVLRRYGTWEAALVPNAMERAAEAAAAPFRCEEMQEFANGRFPRETLAGWTEWDGPMPAEVAAAMRAALPLPTTLAEARIELGAWDERDREREAIHGHYLADTYLSLACRARRLIISDLLYRDLQAVSLADALVRHRLHRDSGGSPSPEEQDAMLADVEHLMQQQETVAAPPATSAAPVQTGRGSASARRAAVLRLLSNMDTARLSDREIARRVGVSPQTVGNLRRRIDGHEPPRQAPLFTREELDRIRCTGRPVAGESPGSREQAS